MKRAALRVGVIAGVDFSRGEWEMSGGWVLWLAVWFYEGGFDGETLEMGVSSITMLWIIRNVKSTAMKNGYIVRGVLLGLHVLPLGEKKKHEDSDVV